MPEVVSWRDWVVEVQVQTGEGVLWVTLRSVFIQVAVPLDEDANGPALMDKIRHLQLSNCIEIEGELAFS